MQPSELSVFIVFLAGVVTIMKPCCLPLVPVIFSGSGGHRLRPLAIVSGLTVSFTTMGVLVSAFGATFGAYTDYLRNIAILFIISMGLVLFDQDVNVEFMKISGSVTQGLRGIGLFNKFSSKMPEGSLMGGFFLGMSLGVLWIPCVGPILGAVLALVASVGNMTYGASMLFVYSIGMSSLCFLLPTMEKRSRTGIDGFQGTGSFLRNCPVLC